MNTWKVVLATLVIFGTGVVTGGLLVAHANHTRFRDDHVVRHELSNHPSVPEPAVANPNRASNAPMGTPQFLRLELLQRIEREMILTSGQHEKIEAIIREGQERTRQILQPIQPQLREELRSAQERIREVLTDEQLRRFDELMQQRPQRRPEDQPGPDRRPREQRRQFPPLNNQPGQPPTPQPGPANP